MTRSKPLKRTLRSIQWLVCQQAKGVFFFYDSSRCPSAFLNPLFLSYGSQGFSSYFQGRSWVSPFWPKHPAFSFLQKGSFWSLYWPSLALWQKACEKFPFLTEPFCGLMAGHFFFRPPEVLEAPLCTILGAVWTPLVDSLFLLTAQMVSFFPEN